MTAKTVYMLVQTCVTRKTYWTKHCIYIAVSLALCNNLHAANNVPAWPDHIHKHQNTSKKSLNKLFRTCISLEQIHSELISKASLDLQMSVQHTGLEDFTMYTYHCVSDTLSTFFVSSCYWNFAEAEILTLQLHFRLLEQQSHHSFYSASSARLTC